MYVSDKYRKSFYICVFFLSRFCSLWYFAEIKIREAECFLCVHMFRMKLKIAGSQIRKYIS